jgi:signal recognition particle receptor subunit alpha
VIASEDFTQRSLIDVEEDILYDDDEEIDSGSSKDGGAGGGGLLSSFVRSMSVNVMGTGALTREDIAPALAELKRKLMERNVAEEIAEKLTESVAVSLEGQKLSSFTRVSSAVRTAVEQALTRILTPKRSIDILREVRASKERGKPYVIVFVGVNGVGKSTNLAKVAYWLCQNGQKVMIAACDTFRSGAVEQLKTHCARLNVPLFERGYEKDPAKVAFEGAKAAQRAGVDVLLVDTAGRMQDNEPLMRALSNLINLNQPDLVLFVGEALVGNDAVDQLSKFNKRLADLAPGPSTHLIDGIVLTKFDTIDDKVGAALSMVYTSGAPIMFVGCGQTYVDLKRLNAKSVVQSLLK